MTCWPAHLSKPLMPAKLPNRRTKRAPLVPSPEFVYPLALIPPEQRLAEAPVRSQALRMPEETGARVLDILPDDDCRKERSTALVLKFADSSQHCVQVAVVD